jgi:hypothetical protein
VLTFLLHWPEEDVSAVVDVDIPDGPDAVEEFTIDKADEELPIPVPVALTYGTKRDFLGFLEAKTRGAKGEVKFLATRAGMDKLENLFPGDRPVEQSMPLPAANPSVNNDSDG